MMSKLKFSFPIILNASNELVVDQFIKGKIPFTGISKIIMSVLKDRNIDICVIGEGEATLAEIVQKLITKLNVQDYVDDIDELYELATKQQLPEPSWDGFILDKFPSPRDESAVRPGRARVARRTSRSSMTIVSGSVAVWAAE